MIIHAPSLHGSARAYVRIVSPNALFLSVYGLSVIGGILLVIAFLYRLAPVEVVEKPLHCGLQALFKSVAGLPTQLAAYQCGVDRIASVVAGAVALRVISRLWFPLWSNRSISEQISSTTWRLLRSPLPPMQ